MDRIDRESFVPYYHQLKVILGDQIRQGALRPDDPLPSEHQLAKEYGVSRATVRKALLELQREGLIHTRKGKGTFVAKPKLEQSLFRFYALGRDLKNRGLALTTRMLRQIETTLPKDIAERMRREAEEPCLLIQRLRLLDGVPLALEMSYIVGDARAALLAADVAARSIYDVVEEATGRRVLKAEEFLEPVVLDEFEARLLRAEVGQPAFHVERFTYMDEVRPFELRKSIVRGDRFRFYTELR